MKSAIDGTANSVKISGLNEDFNEQGEGLTAIEVNRTVNVIVEGANQITDLLSQNQKHLNSIFQVNDTGKLIISGKGTFVFKASLSGGINAIVHNNGGQVEINGATLQGSNNGQVHARAIYQLSGTTVVNDGKLTGCTTRNDQGDINAMTVVGGNFNITGGEFDVENLGTRTDTSYALGLRTDASGMISGGKFQGISATKNLNNFMVMHGSIFSATGEIAPSSTTKTTETVEVCSVIPVVETNITEPSTDKYPTKNVGGLTPGLTVTSVKWYDGSTETNSTFVGGKQYTVKINVATNQFVRFSKTQTSAVLNGNSANIQVASDQKSAVISYTFPGTKKIIDSFEMTLRSANATADLILAGDEMRFYDVTTNHVGFTAVVQSWHNCSSVANANSSNTVTGDFVEGNTYVALIHMNMNSGYAFASNMKIATLNGVTCEFVSGDTWGVSLVCAGTGLVTVTYTGGKGVHPTRTFASVPVGDYILEDQVVSEPSYTMFKCWKVNGYEKYPGEHIVLSGDTTIEAVFIKSVIGLHITIPELETGAMLEDIVPTATEENVEISIDWQGMSGEIEDATYNFFIVVVPKEGFGFKGESEPGFFDGFTINNKMVYYAETPTMLNGPYEFIISYSMQAKVTKAVVTFYCGEHGNGTMETVQKFDLNINSFMPQLDELGMSAEEGYDFVGYAIGSEEADLVQPGDIVKFTQNETVYAMFDVHKHVHNIQYMNGVNATCTNAGSKAYYYCSECSENFEDAEGKTAIEDVLAWERIEPLGHDKGQFIAEIPATDDTNGVLGHYHCARCNADLDANENVLYDLTIPMTNCTHAHIVKVEQVNPTETEYGVKAYYTCEQCGRKYTDEQGKNEIQNFTAWVEGEGRLDKTSNQPTKPTEKSGLGTGAVIGIVIASVVVVGFGGFAVVWFVIKKKTFADLKTVFKK